MNPNQNGDMAAMLQQALAAGAGRGQPQNTEQMDPMQPEMMGMAPDMEQMMDPVAEIQEQLEAVEAQMEMTQDPMELQQLSQIAQQLQQALEAALQQDPAMSDPFAGGGMPPMGGGGY